MQAEGKQAQGCGEGGRKAGQRQIGSGRDRIPLLYPNTVPGLPCLTPDKHQAGFGPAK